MSSVGAVAAVGAAATVFVLASLRARAKPHAARALREPRESSIREEPAGATPENLVAWIPIVVPLSAVSLTLGVYLIYAAVL